MLHCLSSQGLLDGAEEIIVSEQRNEDGDYYQEVSFNLYKTWLSKLVDNFQKSFDSNRVVLVIDNAPYHSKKLDWISISADTKEKLMMFLQQHALP